MKRQAARLARRAGLSLLLFSPIAQQFVSAQTAARAFIHCPGMILTPILGAMAFQQERKGEKVQGIAAAYDAVAITTAMAYGASIFAVSRPIHLKFQEKRWRVNC